MYGKGISLKYCNRHSKSSNILIFRREDAFGRKKYCDMNVRCINEIQFFMQNSINSFSSCCIDEIHPTRIAPVSYYYSFY